MWVIKDLATGLCLYAVHPANAKDMRFAPYLSSSLPKCWVEHAAAVAEFDELVRHNPGFEQRCAVVSVPEQLRGVSSVQD